MNTKARIASILKANSLDYSVARMQTFDLSQLNIVCDIEYELPTNLRLGHLAEKIVAELIKASRNYNVLYENVQLMEEKRTIGEIDFIIEDIDAQQLLHMELAYKFYLYDPNISSDPIRNWIGPNRNDSLSEKLEKLETKQFPLLYHNAAKSAFSNIDIEEVSQTLCLLVSLFVPYAYKGSFSPIFQRSIKGYYLDLETFADLDDTKKAYYIPHKTEWGMDPSENHIWSDLNGVEEYITTSIKEKKTPLCWQKQENSYLEFFIVWW